jgi:D-threo-aldose 1-dehydrogenase
MLARARECAKTCADHATTLPAAALQFPLRHPAVCCVVAGMRTAEQAVLNIEWANATIDPRLWESLA